MARKVISVPVPEGADLRALERAALRDGLALSAWLRETSLEVARLREQKSDAPARGDKS